jgi:D-alanyl-D-alanine carboxypeptidase (penicillin-binding protein 5/6)
MTAYIVFTAIKEGQLKLTDLVTISLHARQQEGSRSFVEVGSKVPADILIKGMIVQSGNDSSVALAEHVGGSESGFAQMMNVYAGRLGMKGTHFDNAAGLPSPTHYTTAHDMARLADALIRDFPQFYNLFSLKEFVWNNIKQQNRNELLGTDPTVDGLKTGHTDSAGFCLVSSANRNGMRLVSVVMGAPTDKAREEASAALLGYGYRFFETAKIKAAKEAVQKIRVYKSGGDLAVLTVPQDIYVTVQRGEAANLKTTMHLTKDPLIAPLEAGQAVGDLTVTGTDGTVLAHSPLVSLSAVAAGGIWTRTVDDVSLWFHH